MKMRGFLSAFPWILSAALILAIVLIIFKFKILNGDQTPANQALTQEAVVTKNKTPNQTPPTQAISDRALKVSADLWLYSSAKDKMFLESKFGTESGIISRIASSLDKSQEKLVSIEQYVELIKANANRPQINVEAPNIQVPITQQQPQSVFKSVNCTTSRVGNTSYTNCY